MKDVTKLFSMVIMISTSSILEVVAQSYVTYNHDAAKMNQITVQEIGAGGLTPAFYYDTSSPTVPWQVLQDGSRSRMPIPLKARWRKEPKSKPLMSPTVRLILPGLQKARRSQAS